MDLCIGYVLNIGQPQLNRALLPLAFCLQIQAYLFDLEIEKFISTKSLRAYLFKRLVSFTQQRETTYSFL